MSSWGVSAASQERGLASRSPLSDRKWRQHVVGRPAGRRSACRPAAASPRSSPPSPSQRGNKQRQLVRMLLDQAVEQVWNGWLGDLVVPLVSDATGSKPAPPAVPPRQLADSNSQFVAVDGVEIHFKEAWPLAEKASASASGNGSGNGSASSSNGSGNGSGAAAGERPTVLLLHGLNGSTFNWRSTMQPLADATGCRVVAFDRPPFGLSERPLSWGQLGDALAYNPYTTEGNARMALGFMDALGLRQVIAVGHSAGAIVSMEIAQRRPDRLAALGFIAPALPTTPENSFARRATLGAQLRFLAIRQLLGNDVLGLRYVRRQILRRRDEVEAGDLRLHNEDFEMAQDVIDGYLRPLRAPHWDRASLLNFRAFSLPSAYDYSALRQPVLLVQGSEDGGLAQNARDLSRLLQAASRPADATQFVELAGIGHVPMDEVPLQLNDLLVGFVRRVVDDGGAGKPAAGAPASNQAAAGASP